MAKKNESWKLTLTCESVWPGLKGYWLQEIHVVKVLCICIHTRTVKMNSLSMSEFLVMRRGLVFRSWEELMKDSPQELTIYLKVKMWFIVNCKTFTVEESTVRMYRNRLLVNMHSVSTQSVRRVCIKYNVYKEISSHPCDMGSVPRESIA